jgi:hypothetical protein
MFVITSPTVRTHLNLLSQLAWLLRQPDVRSALALQEGRERILDVFARLEAGMPRAIGTGRG